MHQREAERALRTLRLSIKLSSWLVTKHRDRIDVRPVQTGVSAGVFELSGAGWSIRLAPQ